MSKIVPLKWLNGELLILDQRKLPGQEKWIVAKKAEHVAKAIESLAVRGAPLIGIAAAYAVALAAQSRNATHASMSDAIERLRVTRPTGYNLFWALKRMAERIESMKSISAQTILREARLIHREDADACIRMGSSERP